MQCWNLDKDKKAHNFGSISSSDSYCSDTSDTSDSDSEIDEIDKQSKATACSGKRLDEKEISNPVEPIDKETKDNYETDSCLIYGKPDRVVKFPPKNSRKRKSCKRKDTTYWVVKKQFEGKDYAYFYAASDKKFVEIGSEDSEDKDSTKRRYTNQIARVECGHGFINEIRFWDSETNADESYDGCGVITELVKVCLNDVELNQASEAVLKAHLVNDLKWKKQKLQETTFTLEEDRGKVLARFIDSSSNKLLPDVCPDMVGMILRARMLKDESKGLKSILEAAQLSAMDWVYFKTFKEEKSGNSKTQFLWQTVKKAYECHNKNGKIDGNVIVTNKNEEKEGVAGKLFFCRAGKNFVKKIN